MAGATIAADGSSVVEGASAVTIVVTAPSLGAPLVVTSVVPFVVGLSVVILGPGVVEGLVDAQLLVAAPGVPAFLLAT